MAYVYDLVIFFMEVLRASPSLLWVLAVVQRAAGLALAPRKAAIIPAWATDLDRAKVNVVAISDAAAVM